MFGQFIKRVNKETIELEKPSLLERKKLETTEDTETDQKKIKLELL